MLATTLILALAVSLIENPSKAIDRFSCSVEVVDVGMGHRDDDTYVFLVWILAKRCILKRSKESP